MGRGAYGGLECAFPFSVLAQSLKCRSGCGDDDIGHRHGNSTQNRAALETEASPSPGKCVLPFLSAPWKRWASQEGEGPHPSQPGRAIATLGTLTLSPTLFLEGGGEGPRGHATGGDCPTGPWRAGRAMLLGAACLASLGGLLSLRPLLALHGQRRG